MGLTPQCHGPHPDCFWADPKWARSYAVCGEDIGILASKERL